VPIAPPLGREKCATLLAPHAPTLDGCFRRAWTSWEKLVASLDAPATALTPRARANTLYDLIVYEIETAFASTPDVITTKKRGFLVVRVGGEVVIRIKKFRGKTLKTSSNATQQTLNFDSQQLELSDETLQPVTHLTAGYLLDDLAVGLDTIAVTCMVEGEHFWAPIEVKVKAAEETAPAHEMRLDDPTTSKPTVRRKQTQPEQETNEGE
jgi:hypothetical protein